MAASPDGHAFATWALGSLKLWDRQTLKRLRVMDTRGSIGCSLAFTGDGRRLIATDRSSVNVWEVHPGASLPLLLLASTTGLIGIRFWTVGVGRS